MSGIFLDRCGDLRLPWVVAIAVFLLGVLCWGVGAGVLWLSTSRGRFIVTTPTGERYEAIKYTAYDKNRIGITTADGRELIIRGDSTVEKVTDIRVETP